MVTGSQGYVIMVNILKDQIYWKYQDFGLTRRISPTYMAMDTACFSADGNQIVACSVIGTMTVFRADDIGITTLQPVEQYMKCEVESNLNSKVVNVLRPIDCTEESLNDQHLRLCQLDGALHSSIKNMYQSPK